MSGFGTSLGLSLSADGDFGMIDVDDGEVRISSFDTAAQNGKGKRRAADEDERGGGKPRTLGGDRVRESVPVRPIASRISCAPPSCAWADASGLAGRLMPPQLVTYLKASIEGSDVLFEGRNSEGDGERMVRRHFLVPVSLCLL